jgi:hypothetical protein
LLSALVCPATTLPNVMLSGLAVRLLASADAGRAAIAPSTNTNTSAKRVAQGMATLP